MDTQSIINTLIQAEIVKAMNNAPEVIDKLIRVALTEKKVDPYTGMPDRYGSSNQVPYLEYLVGEEIRNAALRAVRQAIKDYEPKIEEVVRNALQAEDIVFAFSKSILRTISEDWKITVKFEGEK